MKFEQPLIEARLLRRYKRFLADVELLNGEQLTVHCPNTGSMKHCAEPGYGVWLSVSENLKRKYPHTWELAKDQFGDFIGINTGRANGLVAEALEAGKIKGLQGYTEVRREVKYGENSRVDFLLTGVNETRCFLEVKSVTYHDWDRRGQGLFPDAVSSRGTRHLRDLINVVEQGDQAVLLYCVQHTGIKVVSPAAEIDAEYAATLVEAVAAGVTLMAYGCDISPEEISLTSMLTTQFA